MSKVADFWATVCKTVRHICYRTVVLSDCPVCDVGALWPNGWTDQHETCYGGRPQPSGLCVRWGPSPLLKKGRTPEFSAHVYCGQTAAWIKMPLGMEVGLGPGDFVLDEDPATSRKREHPPHPIFGSCLLWPNCWMDQNASWYGGKRRLRRRCVRWGSQLPLKGAQPSVFGSCLLWPNGWLGEDTTWYGSRPSAQATLY